MPMITAMEEDDDENEHCDIDRYTDQNDHADTNADDSEVDNDGQLEQD